MIVTYSPEMFDEVSALAQRCFDEGALNKTKFNAKKLEATLLHPDVFCALVQDGDGYYGAMIGGIGKESFGDSLIAFDMGLFVLKSKRGGSAAAQLVEKFEHWAKDKGATSITLAQSTGIEVNRTRRFYEGLGYSVVGVVTRKEISDV